MLRSLKNVTPTQSNTIAEEQDDDIDEKDTTSDTDTVSAIKEDDDELREMQPKF